MCVSLARNQTKQDLLDRVKVNGVDEGVGAVVEMAEDQRHVEEQILKHDFTFAQEEAEDEPRRPEDDEEQADKKHGLDDLGLTVLQLGLGGARPACATVAGHHLRLTTHRVENAPVTEDEDGQQHDVKRQKIPDVEASSCRWALPENQRVADAVQYAGGRKGRSSRRGRATDPREYRRRVYHPVAQLLLGPDVVNHLQIALDGNRGQVDQGTLSPGSKNCSSQRCVVRALLY